MMPRSKRREPAKVSVQVKKRKSIQGGFQTFDQKSIFSNTEESNGNLLAIVKRNDPEIIVQVVSDATRHIKEDWPIVLRNRMAGQTKDPNPNLFNSPFRKTLSTVKTSDEGEGLQIGDVIELEGAMLDNAEQALYPWNYKRICNLGCPSKTLLMPEALATIIESRSKESGTAEYRIGVAARGEAQPIHKLLDSIDEMRAFLGNKEPMVNGFVLRGTAKEGDKSKQGLTCFRTKADDEVGMSDDQVILNFINQKANQVINKISEENPWEVIPLYILRPSAIVKHRLEGIAKRLPKLATPEASPYEASFAHCNLVLDFSARPDDPTAIYFNVSRSKPLILEAGIPERATERKLKTFQEVPEPELA